MGERRQRPVSGEAETDNVVFWGLGRGGDVVVGWPVSETPELRPWASRKCSETPLRRASTEVGRWAGLLARLVGGLVRDNLARRFI
jgi:hypothetical protein